jgi:hypothetical protein
MKTNSTLVVKTFNAPGLGYNLEMDTNGNIFTLDENGKRVTRIAFRDDEGVWQIIYTMPVISEQLANLLERQYRAR